ncbi:recombinase family protein [Streptomyces sp. NPDC093795]|uniref:recombinase family protein n=1 Tax=Streptomyces sp. NPDC093795 TaxID=3366051 RepID=UPI00380B454C
MRSEKRMESSLRTDSWARMSPASYWAPHPSLADSLALGRDFDEWLAGRIPVASYARVSRDAAGDGRGVGRQHLNNDDAAAGLGWAVVYRFTDNGVTASDPCVERAAFLHLLRALRARQTAEGFSVCGLIAVEEERLARLQDDYALLCRALTMDEDGCLYLVDVEQLVDVAAEMEAPRGRKPGQARQVESDRASRRRRRSVRDHAHEGRGSGGSRRFGWYGPDATTGRSTNTVLDPDESGYLRSAIDMALAGTSWTAIIDWLTEESVPTVRGSRWAVDTVQSMVTNPAICGYRMVSGELVRDRTSGRPVVGGWQTVATPEEWLRLVERCDRWHSPDRTRAGYKQAYAARLAELGTARSAQERREQADRGRKYLLSGFLRCGYAADGDSICGCKMGGQPPRGTNKHPSYRCVAAKCRKVGRRTDLVDAHVEAVALRVLEERYRDTAPDESAFLAEDQVARLRACENPTDLTRMQLRDLEEDRRSFYAQQADRNLLARFAPERWNSYDIRQKRLALAAVVESVVIRPVPEGRTRNAPFDPALVEVTLKEH